ncbi:2-oxo-4-hydroxy-4-carboxy-5-ureidoimidazoline decarboxylase [Chionoecetes opilio]|uniref:2-oxo-4-hydroxy-4-carboxy-5-ureidoimidazoline decarboxylase n=1 Tax=Chionoecetes opilio TaxID=41210 RepID=A0A8J5CQM9_CHIOP|nr:2-oxo-4-hydroxy-4-carboxy-5-ureidoimidazoline decarboxylase [Chionoecetes opilio]
MFTRLTSRLPVPDSGNVCCHFITCAMDKTQAAGTAPAALRVPQINALSDEQFITIFGNVIEHCPLVAAAVVTSRPIHSLKHLHAEICSFIDELPIRGREGILRSHPDLAGRAAMEGQLTEESRQEQKSAGLGDLTAEERSKLKLLNTSYCLKFGFPFVICARMNKKVAILQGLGVRLNHSAEEELLKGIEEVKKIALLRLKNLVTEDNMDSKV